MSDLSTYAINAYHH